MRVRHWLSIAASVTGLVLSLDARETKSPSTIRSVKGDWADCNTITGTKQDGENQLITVTISEKLTGALNGNFEGIERNVVRKDGSASFNGSGSFSGEVNGRAGTAVMTYSGTVDAKGVATAHWILDQGTDGLVRIDGHGTFEGKQLRPPPAECSDHNLQSAWRGTYNGTVELPEGQSSSSSEKRP